MGYYWLDDDTFDNVKFHIEALADVEVLDRMQDSERKFVDQMIVSLENYDRNLKCSPKQQEWLRGLYNKYINNAKEEVESTDSRFRRWSKD